MTDEAYEKVLDDWDAQYEKSKTECHWCKRQITGLLLDKDGHFACADHVHASVKRCWYAHCRARAKTPNAPLTAEETEHFCVYHGAMLTRQAEIIKVASVMVLEKDPNPIKGWEETVESDGVKVMRARHVDGTLGPEEMRMTRTAPPISDEEIASVGAFTTTLAHNIRIEEEREETDPAYDADAEKAAAAFRICQAFGYDVIAMLGAAWEHVQDDITRYCGAPARLVDHAKAAAIVEKLPPQLQKALGDLVTDPGESGLPF